MSKRWCISALTSTTRTATANSLLSTYPAKTGAALNIEIFTLCDAAADYQGRLNILGVFDTIFAAQFPAVHPFCSVALRIRFPSIEQGEHQLKMHIVDDDGTLLMPPLEGKFKVEMPGNSRMGAINLVLNLGQLRFAKLGEYSIDLAIDGREDASLKFWVKEPPRR